MTNILGKKHIVVLLAVLLLLSGCQMSSHEVTLEPKASQETMEFWEENREDFNDLAKALLTLAEEYEGPRVYREAISLGYEKYYEKLGLTSPFAQYDSRTKQYSEIGVLPESAFRLAATGKIRHILILNAVKVHFAIEGSNPFSDADLQYFRYHSTYARTGLLEEKTYKVIDDHWLIVGYNQAWSPAFGIRGQETNIKQIRVDIEYNQKRENQIEAVFALNEHHVLLYRDRLKDQRYFGEYFVYNHEKELMVDKGVFDYPNPMMLLRDHQVILHQSEEDSTVFFLPIGQEQHCYQFDMEQGKFILQTGEQLPNYVDPATKREEAVRFLIDKVPNLTDPNYDNLLFHQNMLQFSESVVLFSAGIGGKGCYYYYWIDQEDLETSSCWEVDFRSFRSRGIDPTYTLQGGSENPALIFCMPGFSAGEKDLYPADIHEIFIVTPK